MVINNFFSNSKFSINNDVYIVNKDDSYTSNFGKQWKDFQNVQIDSFNNNNISFKFLKRLIFNQENLLNNKNILEIGCGAGRFTEHLVKYAKLCVSVDMSSAIFHNVAKKNKNLIRIKSDLMKLYPKVKFDIIICRGVIQHTPDPYLTIIKLHNFISPKGSVFFDVYKKPKIGLFHPKYLIWRPLFKFFFNYDSTKLFLIKNIKILLKIKKIIRKVFFNSYFISDCIIPVWSYEEKLSLSKELHEKWSILDTLDGLFAKYDKPISNKKLTNFLKKNNFKIVNKDIKNNIFETKLK